MKLFTFYLICFLSLVQVSRAEVQHTVVSDFDDTLKPTNVKSYIGMAYYELFGRSTFLGMAELFQSLAPKAKGFVYVSGSPQTFTGLVKNTLNRNGFPLGEYILSNWELGQTVVDFKSNALDSLAAEKKGPFILLGDDTESDPEIYLNFKARFATEAVAAIYIHGVEGRDLPEGTKSFLVALEVAIQEMIAGRMNVNQVRTVGETILHGNLENLFPAFKKPCPQEKWIQREGMDGALIHLVNRVETRVNEFCTERAKKEAERAEILE